MAIGAVVGAALIAAPSAAVATPLAAEGPIWGSGGRPIAQQDQIDLTTAFLRMTVTGKGLTTAEITAKDTTAALKTAGRLGLIGCLSSASTSTDVRVVFHSFAVQAPLMCFTSHRNATPPCGLP